MTRIINKIKYNKGPSSGFVILFAVTLSAILLAIALGVASIALKEVQFGTSARDTNDAFFAADTGIENILFQDKTTPFVPPAGSTQTWNFTFTGLGSTGLSCAYVSITKDNTATYAPSTGTSVIAKGYNIGNASCDSSNPNRVEREILVSY